MRAADVTLDSRQTRRLQDSTSRRHHTNSTRCSLKHPGPHHMHLHLAQNMATKHWPRHLSHGKQHTLLPMADTLPASGDMPSHKEQRCRWTATATPRTLCRHQRTICNSFHRRNNNKDHRCINHHPYHKHCSSTPLTANNTSDTTSSTGKPSGRTTSGTPQQQPVACQPIYGHQGYGTARYAPPYDPDTDRLTCATPGTPHYQAILDCSRRTSRHRKPPRHKHRLTRTQRPCM